MNNLFYSPIATSPQNMRNLENLQIIQYQYNQQHQHQVCQQYGRYPQQVQPKMVWRQYYTQNVLQKVVEAKWVLQDILLQQTKIRLMNTGFVSEQEEGLCQTLEQTNLRNTAIRSCVFLFE